MTHTELHQTLSLPTSTTHQSCETNAAVEYEYYDWVDETLISIANACNVCGLYDIKQVGYEQQQQQKQQQQKQQTKQLWSTNDLEVSLYQKFLFDESSVHLDD